MDRGRVENRTGRPAVVTEEQKRERRHIRHLVARTGVPAADTDDITQEVLLAIDRSASFAVPEGVTPEKARAAWTQGIVRVQVLRYRAERARVAAEQAFAEPERACPFAEQLVPSAEEEAVLREDLARALDVIATLQPRRRAVFTAHQLDGDSLRDIAAALGVPPNTAWNLLRLAREDVAAELRRLADDHPKATEAQGSRARRSSWHRGAWFG